MININDVAMDLLALERAVSRNPDSAAARINLAAGRKLSRRVPIDPAVLAEFEQYLRELMEP